MTGINAAAGGFPTLVGEGLEMESPATRSLGARSRGAKQRLDEAAYKLFSEKGTTAVGIEEIIDRSGVARMTLYRNYRSKEDLILAFLELRERRWTYEWLVVEATHRSANARERLLVVFDLFDEWFHEKAFEKYFNGCALINTLIDSESRGAAHRAAAKKLANVRKVIRGWASEAKLPNAEEFAQIWQLLMNGAIIAAYEGDRKAAPKAKRAGAMILKGWLKQSDGKPEKTSRRIRASAG